MNDEIKKRVDESWKETVEKEKAAPKKEGDFISPQPDFTFFINTLALQASISLGAVLNPSTNQREESLPQAKFMIDTLSLIKEKTQGNLSQEESRFLENILYELRMQYVSKVQGGAGDDR